MAAIGRCPLRAERVLLPVFRGNQTGYIQRCPCGTRSAFRLAHSQRERVQRQSSDEPKRVGGGERQCLQSLPYGHPDVSRVSTTRNVWHVIPNCLARATADAVAAGAINTFSNVSPNLASAKRALRWKAHTSSASA